MIHTGLWIRVQLMQNIWVNKKRGITTDEIRTVAKENNILPETALILLKRFERDEIPSVLSDTDMVIYDAHMLKDAEKGAKLIAAAIKKGSKICVVNDYDVDGVTSGYIMADGIKTCGSNAMIITPDRILDGYGISKRIIDEAVDYGCEFIVTTDNGIAAYEQINYAVSKGIDVVITDHHEVPFEMVDGEKKYILPKAMAIVDPHQEDCPYPYKSICGAVVAYKVIELLFHLVLKDSQIKEKKLNQYMELAALGTVCDVMPILDENRTIVKKGLNLMKHSAFVGLLMLMDVQQVDKEHISVYDLGFRIGPCINAESRITGCVKNALQLLMESDYKKATEIASYLKGLNDERKHESEEAEQLAIDVVSKDLDCEVYCIYIPDKNPAIMGIVAGRIKEKYNHPVLCFTDDKSGIIKGSGRSIPGYDMFAMLSRHKNLYEAFGGHPGAAGLSLKKENFEELKKVLNMDAKELNPEIYDKIIEVDLFITPDLITQRFISELERLEPFGHENEAPVLAATNILITRMKRIGKTNNYLKLTSVMNNSIYELLYFGDPDQLEKYLEMKYDIKDMTDLYMGTISDIYIDIIYFVKYSEWNGNPSISYIIKEYK